MAVLTLAMFAVTINVIPLLVERGFSYRVAAVTLGWSGQDRWWAGSATPSSRIDVVRV